VSSNTTPNSGNGTLISVNNLKTHFLLDEGILRAVDGVSFSVNYGTTTAIVGESGSGKSVTALSIIRLVQSPPGKIADGEIVYKGVDLLKLKEKEMRKYRGKEIAMVFQEPMTSLNPVFTIGDQIGEVYKIHHRLKKREAREKTIEMLKLVGIPLPEKRVNEYPHNLSGGMRQRVLIAIALACTPSLLIADEPTTALDVTIQAQILDLLAELKEKLNMTVLLITHDLGIVAQNADKVIVMYAGRVMEIAEIGQIFSNPLPPYTKTLPESLLYNITDDMKEGRKIPAIPGTVPDLLELKDECKFADRCDLATDECRICEPNLKNHGDNHFVRCIKT